MALRKNYGWKTLTVLCVLNFSIFLPYLCQRPVNLKTLKLHMKVYRIYSTYACLTFLKHLLIAVELFSDCLLLYIGNGFMHSIICSVWKISVWNSLSTDLKTDFDWFNFMRNLHFKDPGIMSECLHV